MDNNQNDINQPEMKNNTRKIIQDYNFTKDEILEFFMKKEELEVEKAISKLASNTETYIENIVCDNKENSIKFVMKYNNTTSHIQIVKEINNKNNPYKLICSKEENRSCENTNSNYLPIVLKSGKEVKVCDHILLMKNKIKTNILNIINELEDPIKANSYSKYSTIYTDLKKFAFKVPILIEGDRGSGKTYEAYSYAFSQGINPIFIGGHNGIESMDLLGHLIPYNNEDCKRQKNTKDNSNLIDDEDSLFENIITSNNSFKLTWKDGPLTESIRRAKHEKVVLIIDEMLRIPTKELNILLSTFSPIKDMYHLRTGRMLYTEDGVGVEEVISCPVNNLFVIATSNTGNQYSVDSIDPALAERFIVLRKDTTVASLREILELKIYEKNYSKSLLDNIIKFYEIMQNALIQELIEYTPTLRTLSRAIELSNDESEIHMILYKQALLWVKRDIKGLPEKEELEFIEQALKNSFLVNIQ